METKVTKTTLKASEVNAKKAEVKTPATAKTVAAEVKAPVEAAKEETKAPVKAEKKTPAKTEKKAAVKTEKKTAAKTEKKTTTKAAAKTEKAADTSDKKTNVFVQYAGREYNSEEILAKIKETIFAETGKKTFKSLDVYIKPEDDVAYYVVNGKPGSIRL